MLLDKKSTKSVFVIVGCGGVGTIRTNVRSTRSLQNKNTEQNRKCLAIVKEVLGKHFSGLLPLYSCTLGPHTSMQPCYHTPIEWR